MSRMIALLLLGMTVAWIVPGGQAGATPSMSRTAIIDLAKSGVGCPYIWGGTCWDANDKSWKGADCSGYVTKCWQIPTATDTTNCVPHYYTTDTFYNENIHWTAISRDEMDQGDALVRSGHIVLYDSGDKWGSSQIYEARGSAYGIVYRSTTMETTFQARRRNDVTGGTVPPPPPPPPPDTFPLLEINSMVAILPGQPPDFCTLYQSQGIFDLWNSQETEVQIDLVNMGEGSAPNTVLTFWTEEPFIKVVSWSIQSKGPASSNFVLKDSDALQSVPRENPGPIFSLALGTVAVGAIDRVKLRVKAQEFSLGVVDHPDLRVWVAHVDNFYDKTDYFASFDNVGGHQQQNGGDLRTLSQLDVLEREFCDGRDNDCNNQVDEGFVCGQPGSDFQLPPPTHDAGANPWPLIDYGAWTPGLDGGYYSPPSSLAGGRLYGACSYASPEELPDHLPCPVLLLLLVALLPWRWHLGKPLVRAVLRSNPGEE
jgi:hypothetical protein